MSNEEQDAFWNGDAGRTWAARDAQMAALLAPVATTLLDDAAVGETRRALDVGCGGGSGSFMLADRLASGARVLGIDLSAPLLAVARDALTTRGAVGAAVAFAHGDAQTDTFDGGPFDLVFSRFGVMFFDDPVAAFGNLRAQTAPGGRLAFCCWQAIRENPWVALPLKAALGVLPPPPAPMPRAPGPFAFAERDYVDEILTGAGWQDIQITPRHIDLAWPGDAGLQSAVRELLNTGPVGRLLADRDEATRRSVYDAAAELLGNHYRDGALQLEGAIWLVTADNAD